MRRLPLAWLSLALACTTHDPDSRSDGAEPDTATPRAGSIADSDGALVVLHDSLPQALVDAKLKASDQAALLDTLAWAGDDPFALHVRRGPRGQIAGVSARLLAYDATPTLPAAPSIDRAKALLDPGGLVRVLLGIGDDEVFEQRGSMPLAGGEVRFDFVQRHDDLLVHGATAHVVLDAAGRLRRVDATTVPIVSPSDKVVLDDAAAIGIAIADLDSRAEPLWKDVDVEATDAELVLVDHTPIDGQLHERVAWRVRLRAKLPHVAGDREVLVDAELGGVVASIEHARFALDGNDSLAVVSGVIGGSLAMGPARWVGTDGCVPPPFEPSDSPAVRGDLEEAVAALCEADTMLVERTSRDAQFWLDPHGTGISFGVGATPGISIGMNSGGRISFAAGAGRAEIIGHELWHTVMGSSRTAFTPGAPEGSAIEEHMVDIFGMLLERRLDRREDDCLVSDDPDTMAAIGAQVPMPGFSNRPCALEGTPQPWRNACDPTQDNGGWCEGAARYGDMAAGPFDAYGPGEPAMTDSHVASHTNLGIGNRTILGLLGEVDDVPAITAGDAGVEALFVDATVRLPPHSQWSNWADAWVAAAAALDHGDTPGPIESRLRRAYNDAMLWTVPTEVMPSVGGGTAARVDARVDSRPAAASVVLPGGAELTYVFYRDSSNALRYVRRREPAGGAFAEPTSTVGPCTVPGVTTHHDPAAVGRADGALFVAFNDTAVAGTPGNLQLRSLTSAGLGTACDDVWAPMEPGAERVVVGAPALASWTASADRTICDELGGAFGTPFPLITAGAMGLQIGDCVEVIERIPIIDITKLDPSLGPDFWDLLGQPLDQLPALGDPSWFDPANPGLREGLVVDTLPLLRLFAKPDATTTALGKLPNVGPQLARALDPVRGADAVLGELELAWDGVTLGDGFPEGTIETVSLRFVDERLVVAFRDEADRLRVVQVTDTRETDGDDPIPVLTTSFVGDPALGTASARVREWGMPSVELEYLYAMYVHADPDDPTLTNRLSYRVATLLPHDAIPGDPTAFRETLFDAPRRIDDIAEVEGERRQVSYAYARTLRTPVLAGTLGRMNLFTVTLAHGSGAPDDALMTEGPSNSNRVRWASLVVGPNGKLSFDSERPVILPETRVSPIFGTQSTAGAAVVTHGRGRVEWYYATNIDEMGPRMQRRARR